MALPSEAWGNTKGWVIAGVVGVGVLAGVYAVSSAGSVSPPTTLGRDASKWSSIELPPVPADLAEGVDPSADAGRAYRQIADAYAEGVVDRRPYDRFLRPTVTTPAADGTLPMLDDLVDAADSGRGRIFADAPGDVINYDRGPERLDGLFAVGQAAVKQALLLAQRNDGGDLQRSRELLCGAYTLGRRLAEERLTHRELDRGVKLMAESLGGLTTLARVEGDESAVATHQAARQAVADFDRDAVRPVWEAIGTINNLQTTTDLADVHAGDVFAIATSESADPMWRTEAILRLGRMKFDATRPSDRRAAGRVVGGLADSLTDARLRLAAEAARDLDEAGMRAAR